ncbi:hypothetical protein D9M72_642400 [compost metagenome]
MIVDLHRDHAGLLGNIAADHQHHAELADGVGKAENGRGNETGAGQGQYHAEKGIPGIGPQGRGHFERARANRGKSVLQRLDHKRHRIQHRTDDQPRKTEREGAKAE